MLYIHGMGHFHPENIIDNKFLEDLDIGTNDEWIMERVGIKTRRTVLDLEYIRTTRNARPEDATSASSYTNAQMGAQAAKMALQRAGLDASDIGMVIAGGCSAQYSIPAEAAIVAAELGITAPAFDLNSACSSFAFHMHLLRSTLTSALPRYVLCLNIEGVTRCTDYSDRKTAVLFGDGAAATIVSKSMPSRLAIVDTDVGSDSSGWEKITIPTKGFFLQEGSQVQKFAIRKTITLVRGMRERVHTDPHTFHFIGHQANLLMLNNVVNKLEIAEGRHLHNVETFGNCCATGAPSVLAQHWDQFKHGDHIALCVVGSGLSWGSLVVQVDDAVTEEHS